MSDNTRGAGASHIERDTDTRWAHRNPGGMWWLALLLIPLLLAGLIAMMRGGSIGDDLSTRAQAQLDAAGLGDINVDASGRDLTLTAPDGTALSQADLDKATDLVSGVDGVRVASLGEGLSASGAGAGAEGDGSTDGESTEGTDGSADGTDGASTEGTDGESTEGTDGSTDGTDGESTEGTDGETEGTEGGTDGGTAAGCDVATVQGAIDSALGPDFVQFDESASDPNAASQEELAAVVETLTPCTDLTVTVTGYTDKGGSQKRSELRAESVAKTLADGGVTATIETVGGHFSRELGDNNTQEGRDMNRFATIAVK